MPPKIQPNKITESSIPLLTHAIGKSVNSYKPVIKPSLGPGPKLAIKYIAPPKPVISTPAITCISFEGKYSGDGR